jgi:hypothetical protein
MTCMVLAVAGKGGCVPWEPTVDELLAEPIIKAMMAADGVGPGEIVNTLCRAMTARGRYQPAGA